MEILFGQESQVCENKTKNEKLRDCRVIKTGKISAIAKNEAKKADSGYRRIDWCVFKYHIRCVDNPFPRQPACSPDVHTVLPES